MNIFWGLKPVLGIFNIQLFKYIFLLLIFTKLSLAQVIDTCNCATIDFETIPGDSLYEGLVINDQYSDSLGFTFVLEDGTYPHIAKIGQPITAFESAWGDDTPAPDQNTGFYFLTDDGLTSGPGITSYSSSSSVTVSGSSGCGRVISSDCSSEE